MEIFKDIKVPQEPVTDNDFDKLFTKLAAENNCTSGESLEELVKEKYNGAYNLEFNKWAEKLTLDRAKLLEIFKKK